MNSHLRTNQSLLQLQMEKLKRDKYQRELRLNLKTILDLTPNLLTLQTNHSNRLIAKLYPSISDLNSLRILTVLEIIYLLQAYLEILGKHNPSLIADFRVGIIGGGVTGRLILHSILPFSKDGLSTKNITVSTRQTQNFKVYSQYFGIRVHFDNQLTALQSDLLIIATPATLDNWIIKDLKESLQTRIKLAEKKGKVETLSSSLAGKIPIEKPKLASSKPEEAKLKSSEPLAPNSSNSFPFKPLVYILTSDFDSAKCKKVFSFPVLTPSIREKDLTKIKQTLEIFKGKSYESFQIHQRILAWWLMQQQQSKTLQSLDSQSAKQIIRDSSEGTHEKYLRTCLGKILQVFSFVVSNTFQSGSITSSISNTVSVCEGITDKKEGEPLDQIVDVFTCQGEVDETLLKKIRKWQMAYNNYIA